MNNDPKYEATLTPPRFVPQIALKRIQQELQALTLHVITVNHSNGYSAGPSGDDMFRWQGVIEGPPDSPYEHGSFFLYIEFKHDYPFTPPVVKFITKIYHLNVNPYSSRPRDYKGDYHASIDLSIFKDDWSKGLTISDVLAAIYSLLSNPNLESAKANARLGKQPAMAEMIEIYETDRARYEAIAREWTMKVVRG